MVASKFVDLKIHISDYHIETNFHQKWRENEKKNILNYILNEKFEASVKLQIVDHR